MALDVAVLLVVPALALLVLFLVLFLLVFLVLFCALLVAVELEVLAGAAALFACAAKVKGIEASAKAIVANKVFFIFFSPCGPIARLHFHLAPDRQFTR